MRKDSQSEGKLMGVNEIGSRRVEAELILSLKLHYKVQVLYREWGWMTNACIYEVFMWTEAVRCG